MDTIEKRKIIDDEHLRLLSLGFLIDGCITVGFSCLFIFHFVFMYSLSQGMEQFNRGLENFEGVPPMSFFKIFVFILGALIILGIVYGIAKIVSSRFIKQRKYRMFTYIIAIPGMISIPYGTALGIAAMIVLGRPTVIDQYKKQNPYE